MSELTARETAVWDQLVCELSESRVRTAHSRAGRGRRGVLAVLLLATLALLIAGSLAGSEVLAWSGVIAWVAAVLITSHLHGHGPRLPLRR
ncbi:hypothetical protein [Streptomyces sp. NPDC088762]|uniref:hypothetical protein n=1 Tax=Streptomyces sp. NPDC088762 TaxID=3365891 RepID=UPI0038073921